MADGDLRVVIADDEEDVRGMLRMLLSTAPGVVVAGEATDGAEASDLAARLQPDAVLIDLCMPVMTGLEAIPRIRAAVPRARIVVFSAADQEEHRQPAIQAGADVYLVKGVRRSALLAALKDGRSGTEEGRQIC